MVTLPTGVDKIEEYAFDECSALDTMAMVLIYEYFKMNIKE